jgi:hypothetical protein
MVEFFSCEFINKDTVSTASAVNIILRNDWAGRGSSPAQAQNKNGVSLVLSIRGDILQVLVSLNNVGKLASPFFETGNCFFI